MNWVASEEVTDNLPAARGEAKFKAMQGVS